MRFPEDKTKITVFSAFSLFFCTISPGADILDGGLRRGGMLQNFFLTKKTRFFRLFDQKFGSKNPLWACIHALSDFFVIFLVQNAILKVHLEHVYMHYLTFCVIFWWFLVRKCHLVLVYVHFEFRDRFRDRHQICYVSLKKSGASAANDFG